MKHILLALVALSLLGGCASGSQGREYQLNYAKVTKVERVPRPSAVPAGVIVGGLTGLILTRNSASSGKRAAATIGGAVLGGAMADAMDDGRVYEYHLLYRDGQVTRYVTEKAYFRKGDCVVVERGSHANLRRVETSLCGAESIAMSSPELQQNANQCHQAKEQLLAATNDSEVATAARKVELLCQSNR